MMTLTQATPSRLSPTANLINKIFQQTPAYLTSALLLTAMGCAPTTNSDRGADLMDSTAYATSSSAPELGTLEASLRLPERGECHTFSAFHADSDEPLFSVDVEGAQVRNHRYSFLQSLPAGDYTLKGELDCVTESGEAAQYGSLHAQFEIEPSEIGQAQFRFFFDVESDLAGVDLDFCADLSLRQLSPSPVACAGEEINGLYDVSWLRDDCGEVGLIIEIGAQVRDLGSLFSFPEESASITTNAPEEAGQYEMKIGLSSPEGGFIEMYEGEIEVVECEELPSSPDDGAQGKN